MFFVYEKKSTANNTTDESYNPQCIVKQQLPEQNIDIVQKRHFALRQHASFKLNLTIKRGFHLISMDNNGSSDPYVKIKCGRKVLHKSKTISADLNPVWNENLVLPIADPFQPLTFEVFDYDFITQDDFMGSAILDLTQLDLSHTHDMSAELKDPEKPKQYLGEIIITVTLNPQQKKGMHLGNRASSTRVLPMFDAHQEFFQRVNSMFNQIDSSKIPPPERKGTTVNNDSEAFPDEDWSDSDVCEEDWIIVGDYENAQEVLEINPNVKH